MNSNNLLSEALKIEGERFHLFRKMDDCRYRTLNLNEYVKLQKQLDELNMKHEQYLMAHKALAATKRKMRR